MWGETTGIRQGQTFTADEADQTFYDEVCTFTAGVKSMLTMPADKNQLGAMVRFSYNIGLRQDKPRKRGFYWSSVRKLHNEGNFVGAARAFGLQNQFVNPLTGILEVSEGLTTRRMDEAAMYLKPVDGAPDLLMPQEVAPESSMATSHINRGGAVTAGTGAIAAASAMADELKGASDVAAKFHEVSQQVADWFGMPPLLLFGGVLLIVGYLVMKNRNKQREEGWA